MFSRVRMLAVMSLTVAALMVATTAPVAAGGHVYASIAVEPATLAVGWAANYGTRAGAQRRAKQECKARAAVPSNCQVMVWVQDGCAAVSYKNKANGTRRFGWGLGWTKRQAKNNALAALGSGARGLAWVCNG
jgi:hypothetical protein